MTEEPESLFRSAFDTMLEGAQILDRRWRYVYLNASAEKHGRRPAAELLGRTFTAMWPGVESTHLYAELTRCMDDRVAIAMENRFDYPDGAVGWFDLSIQPVPDGILILSFDITGRKLAEQHLLQMKRLYATLSQVNQTITRVHEKQPLFQTICDVAAKHGEFSLVWVGLLDEPTGDVRPAAAAGADPAHWPLRVPNVGGRISNDGLASAAIRTSAVAASADIRADERASAIRTQVASLPFRSGASVPLRLRGKTVGAFTLISGEVGFFDSEDEIRLLEEVGLDISFALEAIETANEKSEAEALMRMWADAFEHCAHGIVIGTPVKDEILTCNPAFARAHGSSVAGLSAMSILDLYEKSEQPRIAGFLAEADARGFVQFESRKLRADGSVYPVQMDVVTVKDEEGKPLYRVATQQDITERKKAEEKLLAGERTLKLFVDIAPAAIAMFDRDMKYIAASRRYCRDYRIPDVDIVGRSHYEIFPEMPERWKAIHRRCLGGAVEWAEEDPFPRADGSVDWVRWEIHPWYRKEGEIAGIILFSEVITERKTRENDLRESEARYRGLIESSNSVIAAIDGDGCFHFVNRIAAAQLGSAPEGIVGKNMHGLFPSHIADVQMRDIRRVLETNEEFVGESLSIVNGKPRWYMVNIQPIRDGSGRAVLAMLNAQDITERRESDLALRQSEEKYRLLAENTSDVIWIMDLKTSRFRYVSPSVTQLIGYTAEEAMAHSLSESLAPSSVRHFAQVLPVRLEEMQRGIIRTYSDEMEHLCRDGSTVWTETTTKFVRNESTGDVEIYGASRNISERRALQSQLLQSQKLESLGTLSSGIAHDFNNILSIIVGNATLLQKPSADAALVQRRIQAIARAGGRGAELVRQLLTFARKTDTQVRPLVLNEVVGEGLRLLDEIMPRSIAVVDLRTRPLPTIEADPTQVQQVLLNLCVNARDAMAAGGTLTLRTYCEPGRSLSAQYANASAAEYVVLSVEDTGGGMDEPTQRRIFEPFFTTKERGKGTGLGLSMVFGIMESHKGFVFVKSEPGKGSSFHCCFPVPESIIEVEPEEAGEPEEAPGGSETVLVVEDEELIRDMLRAFLESKGYTVLTADDGEQGLEVFRAGTVDVVLTDLGLPKKSGADLFHDLVKLKPGLRLILASGFFEPGMKSRLLAEGVSEVIQKPYDPREVLRAIRRALGKP